MTIQVGVIAEDESDVQVVTAFARKIARKPFSVKPVVGHGCGRLRNKCHGWARMLEGRGCSVLLLIHDLDTAHLGQLQNTLRTALGQSPIAKHAIIIPVRELEAWLLSDHDAIQKTFKFKRRLGKIANPEAIQRPKETLRDIIEQRSDRKIIYVNTIHNSKIADHCQISNLLRCLSFRPFQTFIERTLK